MKPVRSATLALLLFAIAVSALAPAPDSDQPPRAVLVFSRTAGFRHDSIPAGVEALRKLAAANGFQITATEDPAVFAKSGLAPFQAVIFLNTTGDVLNDEQQKALEAFIRDGGGFVGIHAATDTEYDWAWYGRLVGARFKSHPAVQKATIDVIDRNHRSTRMLPARWERTDEWYNFAEPPRDVTILAKLDEATYEGGSMSADHPIAWHHDFDGGRAWYTAGGHTVESFSEPLFLEHLLGGLEWAAGWSKADKPRDQPLGSE